MSQEAKHTPTPWKVSQRSNFGNGYIYTTIQPENPVAETMRHLLMANGGYDVCHMMHTPLHSKAELHRANAEFIVTAVNSYASSQAEIARLRKALETIIREDDTGPEQYEISDRTYPPAQALGGSEGRFAAVARAALSVKP